MLAGEIDLMLGRLPRKASNNELVASLAQRVLYEGSLSVVCERKHPLADQRPLPLEALLEWPWVLPNEQSTTRVALMDAFLRQGLDRIKEGENELKAYQDFGEQATVPEYRRFMALIIQNIRKRNLSNERDA